MDVDEVTVALLEASRKLAVSKSSNNINSASSNNNQSINISSSSATGQTITTSSQILSQTFPSSSESLSSNSSPNTSLLSDSSLSSSYSPSSLLHSLLGGIQGVGRNRSVSESHATLEGARVKVDLSPWLADDKGAKEVKVARERLRKNSVKEVEEAMSGGLSSADMYMPPI